MKNANTPCINFMSKCVVRDADVESEGEGGQWTVKQQQQQPLCTSLLRYIHVILTMQSVVGESVVSKKNNP